MSQENRPEIHPKRQSALALREKIAILKTVEYLRERGQGAGADDLAAVLALVPERPKNMTGFLRLRRRKLKS